MFVIVSYDITDDKRRTRIAKTLKDYGTRVQYSVFECNLNDNLFTELLDRIKKIILSEEDTVRFYRLCNACKNKVIIEGIGEKTEDPDVYIF